MIYIEGYGNVYVGVGFSQEPAGTWSWDSIPAHLLFSTCDIGQFTPVEKMRLTNKGALGIGTSDPKSSLHVFGDTRAFTYIPTSKSMPYYGMYSPNGNDVGFSTDITHRLIITNEGLVGIGTSVPAYNLDIKGNTRTSGNLVVSNNLSVSHKASLGSVYVLGNAQIDGFTVLGNNVKILSSIVGNLNVDAQSNFQGSVQLPHNLYFTGNVDFPADITANTFIPKANAVPVYGIYSNTGADVSFSTSTTERLNISGTGLITIPGDVVINGQLTLSSDLNVTGTVAAGSLTADSASIANTCEAGVFLPTQGSIPPNGIFAAYGTDIGFAVNSNWIGSFNANELYVNRPMRTAAYTVNTLPVSPAVSAGSRTFVTDALNPVYLQQVASGGSSVVPVFYDGTKWIVA